MSQLDDEKSVRIYIKDQLKDLFYQLDDMRYSKVSNHKIRICYFDLHSYLIGLLVWHFKVRSKTAVCSN